MNIAKKILKTVERLQKVRPSSKGITKTTRRKKLLSKINHLDAVRKILKGDPTSMEEEWPLNIPMVTKSMDQVNYCQYASRSKKLLQKAEGLPPAKFRSKLFDTPSKALVASEVESTSDRGEEDPSAFKVH